jgi:lipoyl(octanoyl) transferase
MMTCEVSWLGTLEYDEGVRLQERRVADRIEGRVPDALYLLEHPHVITLGRAAHDEHILWDEATRAQKGVQLRPAGRGGDVTYHGPGQLVGYPVVQLGRRDVHAYLRDIEEVLIRTVADWGIVAGRVPAYTGVWVGDAKIAAIGVRVTRWVASHGFALNVSTDLSYFGSIVPCGITSGSVGSMQSLLGKAPPVREVAERVAHHFGVVFGREIVCS